MRLRPECKDNYKYARRSGDYEEALKLSRKLKAELLRSALEETRHLNPHLNDEQYYNFVYNGSH